LVARIASMRVGCPFFSLYLGQWHSHLSQLSFTVVSIRPIMLVEKR
jgi:hypothetical protein